MLTKEEYIKNHSYMSFTRFCKFLNCEAAGLVNYKFSSTKALLIGSYVDAYFSDELEEFKTEHLEIFNSRTGELKTDYIQADELIKRIESDEQLLKFLSGEKQKIFVGEISGVKFKVKIDAYDVNHHITDLKVMKDFKPVWINGYKSNFIEAYNYDIELAIFQEIVFQNTGVRVPCYIAGITKENPSDVGIFSISQKQLDEAMRIVLNNLPRIKLLLEGKVAPHRCEECEYCRKTKKSKVIPYELAGMSGDQLRENGIECDDLKLLEERKKENDTLEKLS